MAKLTEELYAALTTLNKAVFSQPAERDAPTRQTLRPILLKGERYYQLESFQNNKAFHQNFTEEQAADYARENLEGRYRQALIVTQTESRQYILRRDGSYKRTASAAALPRPGGEQAHNREKDYILREGEAIPALVDLGSLPEIIKSSAPAMTSSSRSTALWNWWPRAGRRRAERRSASWTSAAANPT